MANRILRVNMIKSMIPGHPDAIYPVCYYTNNGLYRDALANEEAFYELTKDDLLLWNRVAKTPGQEEITGYLYDDMIDKFDRIREKYKFLTSKQVMQILILKVYKDIIPEMQTADASKRTFGGLECRCAGCNKTPDMLPEFSEHAKFMGISPIEYVRRHEGTYNRANGHFYCTDCFIKAGMPMDCAP